MDEKIYKTLGFTGVSNLVIGITLVIVGVAAGVILIVSGSKSIKARGNHII